MKYTVSKIINDIHEIEESDFQQLSKEAISRVPKLISEVVKPGKGPDVSISFSNFRLTSMRYHADNFLKDDYHQYLLEITVTIEPINK